MKRVVLGVVALLIVSLTVFTVVWLVTSSDAVGTPVRVPFTNADETSASVSTPSYTFELEESEAPTPGGAVFEFDMIN